MTIYKGQMGYWQDRTTGGGNNEHTTRVFIKVGPSEAEKAAAAAKTLQEKQQAEAAAAAAAQKAAADAAAAAEKARQDAVNAAALAGQSMSVSNAQTALNKATADVTRLNQAAQTAASTAAQKRQADAAAKAAENARIAAAQEKARQARQAAADKLKSTDIQSVRGIPATAAPAAFPLAWSVASGGGISLGSDVAGAVWSRISAGLAELRGIMAASMVGPVAFTIAGLLYPKEAGAGSDVVPGRDISTLMPGDALGLSDTTALNRAADAKTTVSMPVRGRMVLRSDGALETQLVRTPVAGNVPVVRGVLDPATGYWSYALPAMQGVPGQTILVSPSDAPGVNGPLGLTGPVPLPENVVHTGDQNWAPQGVTVTVTPVADDLDFNDLILIFPPEALLKPLYVMLRNPRNIPGTAIGNGQKVGNNWLSEAGTGDGAPIPSQVADKLRGREFGSFDAFRRAVWGEVGKESTLTSKFNGSNKKALSKGYSPFPPEAEQVGGRTRYELHHITPIKDGGAVYDIDNIGILTPKRHIDLHKNGK
jgi:hypothetical protein